MRWLSRTSALGAPLPAPFPAERSARSCAAAGLVLLLACLALPAWCPADLGPTSIRDVGVWNTPERFQLVGNRVAIKLGGEAAHVEACLCFLSKDAPWHWDQGKLIWAWPVPSSQPEPRDLRIMAAIDLVAYNPRRQQEMAERIAKFVSSPCAFADRAVLAGKSGDHGSLPWAVREYEMIGISKWLEVESDFLAYMPDRNLLVTVRVAYDQPYAPAAPESPLREFRYVLRTGALWDGPIGRLRIEAAGEEGVTIAGANLPLQSGVLDTTAIEPAEDLLLTVRVPAAPRAPHAYPWLRGQPAHDSLAERIAAPPGYARVPAAAGSFAAWLRGLPLREPGARVFLFDGRQKTRQDVAFAVLDIDVGDRDLQQCADAVIRLRAEYLRQAGLEERIAFAFTSGHPARWLDWRLGRRPVVAGSEVSWAPLAATDSSYWAFRDYLNAVFTYAGSASLARELTAVVDPSRVRPGDVFIRGGHPGHAVMVADVAENAAGERVFLLVQSYMPAQDIHVLANPGAPGSAWYPARKSGRLETPEWVFSYTELRRFPELDGE